MDNRIDNDKTKKEKLQMPFKSLDQGRKHINSSDVAKSNAATKAKAAREAQAAERTRMQQADLNKDARASRVLSKTSGSATTSNATRNMNAKERKQRYGSFLGDDYKPKTGDDSLDKNTSGSSTTSRNRNTTGSSTTSRNRNAPGSRKTAGGSNTFRNNNTSSTRNISGSRKATGNSNTSQHGNTFGNNNNSKKYGKNNKKNNKRNNKRTNTFQSGTNSGSNSVRDTSASDGFRNSRSEQFGVSGKLKNTSSSNNNVNTAKTGNITDTRNAKKSETRNFGTRNTGTGSRRFSGVGKRDQSGRKHSISGSVADSAAANRSRRKASGFENSNHSGSTGSSQSRSSQSRFSRAETSRVGRHSYSTANRGRTVYSPLASGEQDNSYRRPFDRESGRRNRRVQKRRRTFAQIIAVCILALLLYGAVYEVQQSQLKKSGQQTAQSAGTDQEEHVLTRDEIVEKAERMAAGYDYDGAIELIESIDNYSSDEDLTDQIADWENIKQHLVAYTAEDATHIFYHSLVVDADLAFNGGKAANDNYKLWMTTIDEFDRITQTMYDEGYVLVDIQDFYEETTDDDGTVHFTEKSVYLPEDKKPFILSIDDLSYYHCYTGYGMADKLVLDDDGKITCEYTDRDGNVTTGSYDCVPRINDFMEEHPDGAYHNSRGTIALTGYNGVFGYRTDESYVTQDNIDDDKKKWLEEHPDYDYDEECAEATAIADELKAEGWTFASHTWGHLRVGKLKLEKLEEDTRRWMDNVEPIIGETDIIIFAHGQDLASTDEYELDNPKFVYLKSMGFNVFLNVDSHAKTMQVHDTYVHGGRRNLDGYRLWHDAVGDSDWTADLFDASKILDSIRTDMPETDE